MEKLFGKSAVYKFGRKQVLEKKMKSLKMNNAKKMIDVAMTTTSLDPGSRHQ